MINRCPVCDANEHSSVWRSTSPALPIAKEQPEGYKSLFGRIDIAVCHRCGCGFNRLFDLNMAEQLYGDVALTNMPVDPSMHARLEELVQWLPREAMAGGHVLEIGAGGGHLSRIIARIAKRVTLVEPCRQLTRDLVPESNVDLVHDVFPSRNAPAKADLIIARQVLEHVADPAAFVRAVAERLPANGHAFIEVPNAEYIERHGALLDLHLQHVHYFRPAHLIELGRRAGLVPIKVNYIKDGHDFGILFGREIGVAGRPTEDDGERRAARWAAALDRRAEELRSFDVGGLGRVALFGATMHGTVFLNLLRNRDTFSPGLVLDDNVAYDGYGLYTEKRFLPVRRAEPGALDGCDAVVVTAYLHDQVIGAKVRKLGFIGEILTTRVANGSAELDGMTRIFQVVQPADSPSDRESISNGF